MAKTTLPALVQADPMKFILEVFAGLGLAAAVLSFIDVTRNSDTKGWAFGISLLVFVGCRAWAIAS
jgi:hypothetical protein